MPAALLPEGRSTGRTPARARSADRAVRTRRPSAPARIRWDRVGRVALLCVGVALVYLYLSAGIRMLSTWSQSRNDDATVLAMEREHTQLERQHETLGSQRTLEEEARQLGMAKKGEQSYIVSGLPNN